MVIKNKKKLKIRKKKTIRKNMTKNTTTKKISYGGGNSKDAIMKIISNKNKKNIVPSNLIVQPSPQTGFRSRDAQAIAKAKAKEIERQRQRMIKMSSQ